jgi:hypothetical protein
MPPPVPPMTGRTSVRPSGERDLTGSSSPPRQSATPATNRADPIARSENPLRAFHRAQGRRAIIHARTPVRRDNDHKKDRPGNRTEGGSSRAITELSSTLGGLRRDPWPRSAAHGRQLGRGFALQVVGDSRAGLAPSQAHRGRSVKSGPQQTADRGCVSRCGGAVRDVGAGSCPGGGRIRGRRLGLCDRACGCGGGAAVPRRLGPVAPGGDARCPGEPIDGPGADAGIWDHPAGPGMGREPGAGDRGIPGDRNPGRSLAAVVRRWPDHRRAPGGLGRAGHGRAPGGDLVRRGHRR